MVEIVQDNIIPIVSEPFRLIGWIRMLKTEVLAAGIRAHSKELGQTAL